jgi:hypothetical protein
MVPPPVPRTPHGPMTQMIDYCRAMRIPIMAVSSDGRLGTCGLVDSFAFVRCGSRKPIRRTQLLKSYHVIWRSAVQSCTATSNNCGGNYLWNLAQRTCARIARRESIAL